MHVRTYVRTINYDDTHLLMTKAGDSGERMTQDVTTLSRLP